MRIQALPQPEGLKQVQPLSEWLFYFLMYSGSPLTIFLALLGLARKDVTGTVEIYFTLLADIHSKDKLYP